MYAALASPLIAWAPHQMAAAEQTLAVLCRRCTEAPNKVAAKRARASAEQSTDATSKVSTSSAKTSSSCNTSARTTKAGASCTSTCHGQDLQRRGAKRLSNSGPAACTKSSDTVASSDIKGSLKGSVKSGGPDPSSQCGCLAHNSCGANGARTGAHSPRNPPLCSAQGLDSIQGMPSRPFIASGARSSLPGCATPADSQASVQPSSGHGSQCKHSCTLPCSEASGLAAVELEPAKSTSLMLPCWCASPAQSESQQHSGQDMACKTLEQCDDVPEAAGCPDNAASPCNESTRCNVVGATSPNPAADSGLSSKGLVHRPSSSAAAQQFFQESAAPRPGEGLLGQVEEADNSPGAS